MNNETKILLVDDRPENLLTLESILSEDHRSFLSATSGAEALIMTNLENFDLILLDYRMDDMNGVELARALRAKPETAHIPILMVTALSKRECPNLDEFEPGTIDVLYKPLDINTARTKTRQFEELAHLKRNSVKV